MSQDKAFSILFFSLINNILQMADSPGKFAHYLAQQVKSILGVDTVLVVSSDGLLPAPELLSACPDRRRARFDIPSFYTMLSGCQGLAESVFVSAESATEAEKAFLTEADISNCLITPMVSGGNQEGFVVLAELWETTNMAGIIDALNHISGVCALIVRNARLFNHLETLVEERTSQLEAKNAELEASHLQLQTQNEELSRLNNQLHSINDALRTGEEKYRLVVESIKEGVGLVNDRDEFTYLNKAACEIFGYEENELLGQSLASFTEPDMFNKVLEQTELRRKGNVSVYELTIRHKSGRMREIVVTASPIGTPDSFKGTYGIFRDITEQNEARRAIEESGRRYRAIFQTIPDAVTISSLDGVYIDVNVGFTRISGYLRDDVIGRSAVDIGLWSSVADREKVLGEFRKTGALENFEVNLNKKDGTTVICLMSVNTIYINEKPCLLAVSRDITDRKMIERELIKAKEKAEESDQLKTAFLQNMSHEIRTPMNAIMGFSDLLPSFFGNRSKLVQFTKIIHQRSADLLDIINDILDISKIEAGQLPVHIEEFQIEAFFADLESFFVGYRKKVQREAVELQFKLPVELRNTSLRTDKGKLKQIFINLLSNAFKFTPQGRVEAGCYFDEEGRLMFFVSDTGIGIPSDRQAFVFERFSQVDYKATRQYGGTGLGLPIVKGLLGLLNGAVRLESEPGRGSRFTFQFAYQLVDSPPEQNICTDKDRPDDNSLQGNVLVVEDDAFNREFIREILLSTSLEVFFAETAAETLEMTQNLPVDLVLLDIRLPDGDGFALASQLKAIRPRLRIIAQTAYASAADRDMALRSGCNDYISKPVDVTELLIKMCEQLNSR